MGALFRSGKRSDYLDAAGGAKEAGGELCSSARPLKREGESVAVGGVERDLEALGGDGPCVGGAGNEGGTVVHRLIGRGGGHVGDGEVAADAG